MSCGCPLSCPLLCYAFVGWLGVAKMLEIYVMRLPVKLSVALLFACRLASCRENLKIMSCGCPLRCPLLCYGLTYQGYDSSTYQGYDLSTYQGYDLTTYHAYDLSTYQGYDSSTYQGYDLSTYQGYDLSTCLSVGLLS